MLSEQNQHVHAFKIYFSPKPEQLKFANYGYKNLLCKIQLHFTPVVDNFLTTHRFLHFALQVSIFDTIGLRDLEAILQWDGADKKGTLKKDVLQSNMKFSTFWTATWERKVIKKKKKEHRKSFPNCVSFRLKLLADMKVYLQMKSLR